MCQHITPYFVIDGNRRKYREGFFRKGVKKGTCLVVAGAKGSDIKVFDSIGRGIRAGCDQHLSVQTDYPDFRVQVSGHRHKMGGYIFQRHGAPVIVGGIVGSQKIGFPVQVRGSVPLYVIQGQPGGEDGNGEKAKDTKGGIPQ